MALSTAYAQTLYEGGTQVKHPGPLLASTTVPGGTLACNDSGVVKPYTGALVAAGATFLGYPVSTLKETTGSNYTPPVSQPFVFRRGTRMVLAGKAGNLPTVAMIGALVDLVDNFTCTSETHTTGFTQAILTAINADGSFEVQLP